MKERWKPVPRYERYFVSECGRIWDTWRKELMRQTLSDKGYLTVQLNPWESNRRKGWKVHRVVMLAFNGPSELTVDHKDRNKTNNHLDNLEYVTLAENVSRAYKKFATSTISNQKTCHLCSV